MRGAPHSGFSTLIRRISAHRSGSIIGRSPREQDFQRQYRRNPARCQRTRVSGRMIVMALRTYGKHRYRMTMDWIERLFGISPDGGDGSLEALIVAACCTVVVVLIVLSFRRPIQQFLRGRSQ